MSGSVRGTIKRTNLALTRPVSLGGVERPFMVLNLTFTAIVFYAAFPHWPMVFGIVTTIVMHWLGRSFYKADPHFIRVYKRYNNFSTRVGKYMFAQKSVSCNITNKYTPKSVI